MSDAEQEYGTQQVPDEERHDEDEPEDCGAVWGWHSEHWCDEPRGHEMQHFCVCGDERDRGEADRESSDA